MPIATVKLIDAVPGERSSDLSSQGIDSVLSDFLMTTLQLDVITRYRRPLINVDQIYPQIREQKARFAMLTNQHPIRTPLLPQVCCQIVKAKQVAKAAVGGVLTFRIDSKDLISTDRLKAAINKGAILEVRLISVDVFGSDVMSFNSKSKTAIRGAALTSAADIPTTNDTHLIKLTIFIIPPNSDNDSPETIAPNPQYRPSQTIPLRAV